ncbi:MAG: glycosyltransferase family 1 protein [Spirochaetota bacterium]|nr:glycosyltransferase family 1 protein [Spirochaetota bacterium]
MKIAINARVLNDRQGGPYRYLYNILRELSVIDKKNIYYILLKEEIHLDFAMPNNFRMIIRRIRNKFIYDYIYIPIFSYLNRIDVFLFPKNTYSPIIRGRKIPVYHDIVYFEKFNFREFRFFDNLHHKLMIPVAAKFSYIDLTVSEFTASRMIELLNIEKNRIRIITEGVEKKFRKITDKNILKGVIMKYDLKMPFYLYIGSLSPRKNMINVLKAFLRIKDRVEHNIYFIGGYSWRDNKVYDFIKEHDLSQRVIKLDYLEDDELVAIYNLADCFLYPSKYEGFGLPILEAQACGCPVITSRVSSCPEVAGEGGLLVNPYDIDDIAKGMLEIANNMALKSEIIEKGFDNCKKYSWERTAREFIRLFEDVHL